MKRIEDFESEEEKVFVVRHPAYLWVIEMWVMAAEVLSKHEWIEEVQNAEIEAE